MVFAIFRGSFVAAWIVLAATKVLLPSCPVRADMMAFPGFSFAGKVPGDLTKGWNSIATLQFRDLVFCRDIAPEDFLEWHSSYGVGEARILSVRHGTRTTLGLSPIELAILPLSINIGAENVHVRTWTVNALRRPPQDGPLELCADEVMRGAFATAAPDPAIVLVCPGGMLRGGDAASVKMYLGWSGGLATAMGLSKPNVTDLAKVIPTPFGQSR